MEHNSIRFLCLTLYYDYCDLNNITCFIECYVDSIIVLMKKILLHNLKIKIFCIRIVSIDIINSHKIKKN